MRREAREAAERLARVLRAHGGVTDDAAEAETRSEEVGGAIEAALDAGVPATLRVNGGAAGPGGTLLGTALAAGVRPACVARLLAGGARVGDRNARGVSALEEMARAEEGPYEEEVLALLGPAIEEAGGYVEVGEAIARSAERIARWRRAGVTASTSALRRGAARSGSPATHWTILHREGGLGPELAFATMLVDGHEAQWTEGEQIAGARLVAAAVTDWAALIGQLAGGPALGGTGPIGLIERLAEEAGGAIETALAAAPPAQRVAVALRALGAARAAKGTATAVRWIERVAGTARAARGGDAWREDWALAYLAGAGRLDAAGAGTMGRIEAGLGPASTALRTRVAVTLVLAETGARRERIEAAGALAHDWVIEALEGDAEEGIATHDAIGRRAGGQDPIASAQSVVEELERTPEHDGEDGGGGPPRRLVWQLIEAGERTSAETLIGRPRRSTTRCSRGG